MDDAISNVRDNVESVLGVVNVEKDKAEDGTGQNRDDDGKDFSSKGSCSSSTGVLHRRGSVWLLLLIELTQKGRGRVVSARSVESCLSENVADSTKREACEIQNQHLTREKRKEYQNIR